MKGLKTIKKKNKTPFSLKAREDHYGLAHMSIIYKLYPFKRPLAVSPYRHDVNKISLTSCFLFR